MKFILSISLVLSLLVISCSTEETFPEIPANFSGDMIYGGKANAMDKGAIIHLGMEDSITNKAQLVITKNLKYWVNDTLQYIDSLSGVATGVSLIIYSRDTLGIRTGVYKKNDVQKPKRPGAFDSAQILLDVDFSAEEEEEEAGIIQIRTGEVSLEQIALNNYKITMLAIDQFGQKITVEAEGVVELFPIITFF